MLKKRITWSSSRANIKTLGTDVIMQNTPIQCVKLTTFLGVIIDKIG